MKKFGLSCGRKIKEQIRVEEYFDGNEIERKTHHGAVGLID